MKLSDFDFDLPDRMIATRPARPRSASRMLVATPNTMTEAVAADLPDYLQAGDRLVLNDTRVIPARLFGKRWRDGAEGRRAAKMDVTLLGPTTEGNWKALIRPLKKLKIGEVVAFGDGFSAKLLDKDDGVAVLGFNVKGEEFDAALARVGAMPLPPYIAGKRAADEQDKKDYQTVWARELGAVAAPTASLHFDDALLARLAEKGVKFTYVTLHVGAGTFLPVKVDDIRDHKMHAERGEVSQKAADEINQTKADGGRVIPVGTTALRLIETAAATTGKVTAWRGETDIFITPGFKFQVTDALMTNFHLPKSTLMMLVSALIGTKRVREIYAHAIAKEYRFFSYGDASLLLPGGEIRHD
jgi:S-adenosylmethionine:tRNA ribosyltransferase-isomerase